MREVPKPHSLVQVKPGDLTRALVNADLWLDDESSLAFIQFEASGIRTYSTDGFVAMTDFCPYVGSPEELGLLADEPTFHVMPEAIDQLLVYTRKGTKVIEVDVLEDRFEIPVSLSYDEATKKYTLGEGTSGFGEYVLSPPWASVLLEEDDRDEEILLSRIAVRAERFLKLSRVRADSLAPIDMKFINPWNSNAPAMALVKIGATFRAAVNLVNREVAMKNAAEGAEDKSGYFWK